MTDRAVPVRLALADLKVHPLCLGGAVFGWTADEQSSMAVLDAYVEAGGNFIDTADAYMHWVDGNTGGESERIIGRWLARRGGRDDLVLSTKVGRLPPYEGLSRKAITGAIDGSLRRLGVDHVDLYYCHLEDPVTPVEETMQALAELVDAGKVRYIGASNWSQDRLAEALRIADANGWPRFAAVQEWYSLVERLRFEQGVGRLCARERLACVAFYALASGFLTGKYRHGSHVESVRSKRAMHYLEGGGVEILAVLDEIAAAHTKTVAAVSLAWVAAKEVVVCPAASARTVPQLEELLAFTTLRLEADEIEMLDNASMNVHPSERTIADAF